jgi:hypothetical protein
MSMQPLCVELLIDDPEVLAWLNQFEESDRAAKAATSMRIGVLALRRCKRVHRLPSD